MILAILQARVSSKRLPGKVLKPILGKPMLALQIERLKRARKVDRVVIATSTDASDDALEKLARDLGIECFRGSLEDVLDRFYQAALRHQPEHVVRITGDCPVLDPAIVDRLIEFYLQGGYEYASNALEPTFPDGLDAEVMRFAALERAWKEAKLTSQREHVTPYLYQDRARFRVGVLKNDRDLSKLRWTVDEENDYRLISAIYEALYPRNPAFSMEDVLRLLESRPELSAMNSKTQRNEGYERSLKEDQKQMKPDPRYARSTEMLARAEKSIPLGSQTFSKSRTQYPVGAAPLFMKKAKGSRLWDVDGNEYVDFNNALCSIVLGHCDPDVNAAVRAQLEDGIIFSLPHPLEHLVAEKLIEMVPCAEKVRFGKNGSDATAGAVRLARAHTGRDRVAVCGYHGWQDWYIGTTARNRGVPKAVRELSHTFTYNKIETLDALFKQHPGEFAAVILEPMNVTYPEKGFLEAVRDLTHKHGALLVFDETITGFRYSNGGAQELFGVTPDLATFGKGLANGYPVAAVAGKAEYMKLMEEIFFSFTFGGETLSLAAALASMTKMQKEPVLKTVRERGEKLLQGLRERVTRHGVGEFLDTGGHPSWSFLLFKDAPNGVSQWHIKTLFLQETLARGVLTLGTHNMSYAHSEADVDRLLKAYDEVFPLLADGVKGKDIEKRLHCKPLEPLFKIR